MTRIIVLGDTHHGGGPEGYHLQTCYIDRIPELLEVLGRWIATTGGADLVLHAGDVVERAEPQVIREAVAQLAVLPAPVRLTLGNHDLTTPGALGLWQAHGGDLLPGGQSAYAVSLDDCTVHVLPTHWGGAHYDWDGGRPLAALAPYDLVALEQRLEAEPERTQLLACHAAPAGISAIRLGTAEDRDVPPAAYVAAFRGLVERHPNLRLVLSGHGHLNCLGRLGGAHWLMTTAFSESPFEVKEITVTPSNLKVRTVPLHGLLGWHAEYNWDAAYVQGRPCDRTLDVNW